MKSLANRYSNIKTPPIRNMIFDKKVQIPLKNKNNFIQGDYMKK
ncbi:hypothetical protein UT300012_40110 [Paraclostridium bifermentans]